MSDYLAFVAAVVSALLVSQFVLWRFHRLARPPWLLVAALGVMLIAGYFLAEDAAEREEARLREMIAGIAPTYAQELQRLGHGLIGLDTGPDDPTYLTLIEAQKRWLAANHSVADIYTMTRTDDGQLAFLVDSETDYDHDGQFVGDREGRTEIGETYDQPDAEMLNTFTGQAGFSARPETDRWGTWVSAYEPLRGSDGRVAAILGVDYDASLWTGAIARARAFPLGALVLIAFLFVGSSAAGAVLRAELRGRRRAEAEVRRVNAGLEQEVADRTAALRGANQELQQRIRAQQEAQVRIEQMHKELLDVSLEAGKAQIATGVLHNVGNVLTSVNVSSELVADTVRTSRLVNFTKLTALLRAHQGDLATFLTADPKGRQVPGYLITLADHLAEEQALLTRELAALSKHIEHIRHIVSTQQHYARLPGVVEMLSASDLVDDALLISGASLERHHIDVARRFAEVPRVATERHKAIQILVNLIGNAKEAMEGRREGRHLLLDIAVNGSGRVRIAVTDNGVGIDAATMARLFSHGFTTKETGHGFGLHNSALLARELGGTLKAASDGADRGATFTLELPIAPHDHSTGEPT